MKVAKGFTLPVTNQENCKKIDREYSRGSVHLFFLDGHGLEYA